MGSPEDSFCPGERHPSFTETPSSRGRNGRGIPPVAGFFLPSLPATGSPEQTFPSLLHRRGGRGGSAAQETLRRAGSPVKIGVVGEFNAGKSLLLGSLTGYADALPVSEVPTTAGLRILASVVRFSPRA
jgi:hypothetical protein